jgi:DNA-binding response OmpR family regulator
MGDLLSAAATRGRNPRSSSLGPVRLAVLDRDSGFLRVFGKRAQDLGWEQRTLASPVAVEELVAMRLNAMVIDLAILGPQAWDYLERVCLGVPALGILVCTGPSSVAQRVRGLRLGAHDWITKPCHPEEVVARVEAVVRRGRRGVSPAGREPVVTGEIEIHSDQFQVFVAGASLDLTRREFELIELLAAAEGRVLEREEIYERIWGYTMVRGDRSVDVFVRKLRHKLEQASPGWRYIYTHVGVGYRFAPQPVIATEPVEPARQISFEPGPSYVSAREPALLPAP